MNDTMASNLAKVHFSLKQDTSKLNFNSNFYSILQIMQKYLIFFFFFAKKSEEGDHVALSYDNAASA